MRRKPIRLVYFTPWATQFQDAGAYLSTFNHEESDSEIVETDKSTTARTAKIDRALDAEMLQSFTQPANRGIPLLPTKVVSATHLSDMLEYTRSHPYEEIYFILTGTRPKALDASLGHILKLFNRFGGKTFYWSWDEASTHVASLVTDIAPYVDFFIHDETTLPEPLLQSFKHGSVRLQRSPAANVPAFAYPFHDTVVEKILFIGSEIGLTPSRRRQIEALRYHFGENFIYSTNSTMPLDARMHLGKIKVNWCPEGRFYKQRNMSQSHTDRPFWAGCLGQIPVIEDSQWGDRLESYVQAGYVYKYNNDSIRSLIESCERALKATDGERLRIYNFFNTHETFGTVTHNLLEAMTARMVS